MIADVLGLEISPTGFGGDAKERYDWPQSADVLFIGRKARLSGWSISRADAKLSQGLVFRLVPHSRLHALSVLAERMHPSCFSHSNSSHHRFFVQKAASAFSHPDLQHDLDNLLLVASNRWGKQNRLGYLAIDLESLPSLYDVAIVLMRAIGQDGKIVVRAVPLLEGFKNVTPVHETEAYKHPDGVKYELLTPMEPATIKSAVELSTGENKLSIVPVYE